MSDPGVSQGIMWSVAEEFMAERSELAEEQELLLEVNDRIPSAAALGFADLSESVAVCMKEGMTDEEIAAMLAVTRDYLLNRGSSIMAPPAPVGGFT